MLLITIIIMIIKMIYTAIYIQSIYAVAFFLFGGGVGVWSSAQEELSVSQQDILLSRCFFMVQLLIAHYFLNLPTLVPFWLYK